MDTELFELGVELTGLAVKGTATAVMTKLKTIKDEKNIEKIRNTYDEIVNELIKEKEDAVRIAQLYKSELDRTFISDESILHLNNTVSRLLGMLRHFNPRLNLDDFEQLKELIYVDTLKTMQLLGFSYKDAIGKPLTNLCANAISSFGNKNAQNMNHNRKK